MQRIESDKNQKDSQSGKAQQGGGADAENTDYLGESVA